MSDTVIGFIVIGAIVAITLFGGVKNSHNSNGGLFGPQPATQSQTTEQTNLEDQIQQAQKQVDNLEKEVQLTTESPYKDIVKIQYVNRGYNASQEYIVLHMKNSTTTVPITGWTLKSLKSGNGVTIPKGTYLIFERSINTEDPIVLSGNDTVYILTGKSPNGYSFKVNKCSGYMSQFQTFIPYLYTNCPAPRNEDLSSIPETMNNDSCFDYINNYPYCRTQVGPLPQGLSGECQNFIYNKINYASCVDTHKYDKDFYQNDWRVYLGRSDKLWKNSRENIVLYDNQGKIVDSLTY